MNQITYEACREASTKCGENNKVDCAVKAVAIACQIPYEQAHDELMRHGRKFKRRTPYGLPEIAIAALGYELVPVPRLEFAKTVKSAAENLPRHKTYIVQTRGHILTIRNGKAECWTDGRKHRVKKMWEIRQPQMAAAGEPLPQIKNKAERLMRLIDRSGCDFDFVIKNLDMFKDQFRAAKLKRADITPELIAQARAMEHAETVHIKRFNRPKRAFVAPETITPAKRTAPETKPQTDPIKDERWELINGCLTPKEKPAKPETKKRKKIFEYSVTSVLIWMGKHDWTFEDAKAVLEHLGIHTADITIRVNLNAGNGTGCDRGPAAKLTKAEAAELDRIWENC